MTLPAPNLDDLRFQSDLVDEARKRITSYCPEWTNYNLSDPGITLIELFAWMTELTCYRLNRVPERNYIKFLEMLGFQLLAAQSASTNLTFWLSALLPLTPDDDMVVTVPAGCEVRSDQQEACIFTTDRKLDIYPPLLSNIRKEGYFSKNYFSRLGLDVFRPFDEVGPKIGDTFYLGFDKKNNLSGHVLRLFFDCEATEAVGIRREDPPWVWECLTSEGWVETSPSHFEGETDTTGGLNNAEGSLVLYTPLGFSVETLNGLEGFWIRCRIEQRNKLQGMFTESPRVKNLHVYTMGAQVPATHSRIIEDEFLGQSNGEAGQTFVVSSFPVLALAEGETIEVEEFIEGEEHFVPWTVVNDFSKSTRYDRHFVLETATGTIRFGPSIRQSDGVVTQYGKIPESGKGIRFTRYRYGGGVSGNLPENMINSLGMSLAYISRASNLVRAIGGRDQETLDELIYRAQRELQAQKRAVTAEDFEQFTLNSSRSVARAHCVRPESKADNAAGTVTILAVPQVRDALRSGNMRSLHLEDDLRRKIVQYLDQYRLMTTNLVVREPDYYGVKVRAVLIPHDFVSAQEAQNRVEEELGKFLTPLAWDAKHPLLDYAEKWEGWEFGRSVFKAEIISLIQKIPCIKYVIDAEVSWRVIIPVDESMPEEILKEEVVKPIDKVLKIPPTGLICSLTHEVKILSLDDLNEPSEDAS